MTEKNIERLKAYIIEDIENIADDPIGYLDDTKPIKEQVDEWINICQEVGIDLLSHIETSCTEYEYDRMKSIITHKDKTLDQILDILDLQDL